MKNFFRDFFTTRQKNSVSRSGSVHLRRLTFESLEQRDLLSGAPIELQPVLLDGILRIEGTDQDDWVEIEETAQCIVVHSFGEAGTEKIAQWTFPKSDVKRIDFYGHEGNDTFKNQYLDTVCSIPCRAEGGTGNNTLVGGNGNDYLHGGNGNNILDGGKGDNLVIGGFGSNLFYNGGGGSTAFVWMGDDRWATEHSNDTDDALLVFTTTGHDGQSSYRYGGVTFTYRPWMEREVFSIVEVVSHAYDVIGNYAFFQHSTYADRSIRFCVTDNRDVTFSGITIYESAIVFAVNRGGLSSSTIIHEVAHLWNFAPGNSYWGNPNPFWEEFWAISWQSESGPLKPDSVLGDFAREYGRTAPFEDWATTVPLVVYGNSPFTATARWDMKVDVVNRFFDLIGNRETPTIIDPTHLVCTEITQTSVSLAWAVSEPVDGYELQYKKIGDEHWTHVPNPVETNAIVTDLEQKTLYEFRLRTKNIAGFSGWLFLETTTLQAPPIAVIACETPTIQWGCNAFLTAAQSSDPNGERLEYHWDIRGDGVYEIGEATQWFSTENLAWNENPVRVALLVVNQTGLSSEPVFLTFEMSDVPPSFSVQKPLKENLTALTPTLWEFEAVGSVFDPIVEWSIDWGDGSEPSVVYGGPRYRISLSHRFENAGDYQVTITTTGHLGTVSTVVYGTVNVGNKEIVTEIREPEGINFVTEWKAAERNDLHSFFVLDDLVRQREELRLRLMLDLDQSEEKTDTKNRLTVADQVFCDERLFDVF